MSIALFGLLFTLSLRLAAAEALIALSHTRFVLEVSSGVTRSCLRAGGCKSTPTTLLSFFAHALPLFIHPTQ